MTKHTCSGVWKHANRLTRKGWWETFTVSKIRFSHIRLEGEEKNNSGGGENEICAFRVQLQSLA
jgi:hypothetical protein